MAKLPMGKKNPRQRHAKESRKRLARRHRGAAQERKNERTMRGARKLRAPHRQNKTFFSSFNPPMREYRPAGNRPRLRIKGADRIELKRMLKELAADGLIADARRRVRKEAMPSVTVLIVRGQNRERRSHSRSACIGMRKTTARPAHSVSKSPAAMKGRRLALAITCSRALGDGARGRAIRPILVHRLPDKTSSPRQTATTGPFARHGSRLIVESIDKKDHERVARRFVRPPDEPCGGGELVRFEIVRDMRERSPIGPYH